MSKKRILIIIWLLRIGAIIALITAGLLALTMASFATDDPSSSKNTALMIGIFFFVIFAIPATWLPLRATRSITKHGTHGLLLATIFSVISIIFLFPLGTIIGFALLYQIRCVMIKI